MALSQYDAALEAVTLNLASACGADDLSTDSRLDDLDLDSLVRIELAVVLSDAFGIEMSAQALEEAVTIHDVCTLVVAQAGFQP